METLKEIWESPRAKENLTMVGFEPTTSELDFPYYTDWATRPVRQQIGVI